MYLCYVVYSFTRKPDLCFKNKEYIAKSAQNDFIGCWGHHMINKPFRPSQCL